MVAFPAAARVWRVEDIQAGCFNRVAQTVTLRDLGRQKVDPAMILSRVHLSAGSACPGFHKPA